MRRHSGQPGRARSSARPLAHPAPQSADDDRIAGARRDGIRLICPGDAEWPGALDQLAQDRPYALWLRGNADLRFSCLRSVSIVGSRAATAYGCYVAAELRRPRSRARLGGGLGRRLRRRRRGASRRARPPRRSRSRCWPAASTIPTRRATRTCSTRSPPRAWWSASGRRAATPARLGSWSATGSSPRWLRHRDRRGGPAQRRAEHRTARRATWDAG